MSYRPSFCCQCGEKIDRVEWRLLTSRRFCELCATEYGIYDKIPLVFAATGILFGLFGIGIYLRTPQRTLNLAPNNLVSSVQNANKSAMSHTVPIPQERSQTDNSGLTKADILAPAQNPKAQKLEPAEAVYFCGAATKKGTPCSRRVKGGGRCWQHMGQTAMVAQEKLKVGNN